MVMFVGACLESKNNFRSDLEKLYLELSFAHSLETNNFHPAGSSNVSCMIVMDYFVILQVKFTKNAPHLFERCCLKDVYLVYGFAIGTLEFCRIVDHSALHPDPQVTDMT